MPVTAIKDIPPYQAQPIDITLLADKLDAALKAGVAKRQQVLLGFSCFYHQAYKEWRQTILIDVSRRPPRRKVFGSLDDGLDYLLKEAISDPILPTHSFDALAVSELVVELIKQGRPFEFSGDFRKTSGKLFGARILGGQLHHGNDSGNVRGNIAEAVLLEAAHKAGINIPFPTSAASWIKSI